MLLVTGAAGFIGSNLVRYLLHLGTDIEILALDALTYSGHRESLGTALTDERVEFVHGDIRNADLIRSLFSERDIEGVIHLAAESHVDRSIDSPMDFVTTNIQGTATLLAEADRHWKQYPNRRFHHVSTDEVFGTLGTTGYFSESSPYSPRSPYAASKAASDHLVRAWGETYGLNVVITNCTNNYGPYQFPEKLIPVTIDRLSHQNQIPVYGDGSNVRDWLYVADHCEALFTVYSRGTAGDTYCIGGRSEVTNLDLVNRICDIYDDLTEQSAGTSRNLIEFVTDRPGHDFRYAMDISKIGAELGWAPSVDQDEGLRKTVKWYLENQGWVEAVRNDDHDQFQERWYQ